MPLATRPLEINGQAQVNAIQLLIKYLLLVVVNTQATIQAVA